MNFDYNTPEADLWVEFGDAATVIDRKIEILWIIGHKRQWQMANNNPLEYWLPALEMARERGLRKEWLHLCDDIARYHVTKLEDNLEGIKYADEGLGLVPDVSFDIEELEFRAHLTWGKAVALENLERFDEALYSYRTAVGMYSDIGNHKVCKIVKLDVVLCLVELKMFDEAEEHIAALRPEFQEEEEISKLANLDMFQARIWLERNREEEALNLLLSTKAVLVALDKVNGEFLKTLAYAYYRNLEYPAAEATYIEAIAMALRGHSPEYREATKLYMQLADALEAQGNLDEANNARFTAESFLERLPNPPVSDSASDFNEIEKLRASGNFELAMQLGSEVVEDQAEAGNIALHLKAECENIVTMFFKNDHESVIALWEQLPKPALELQDELALRIKNMAVHSMFKTGKVEEASKLCYQVLADVRIQENKQELAYAYENLAEIEQDPQLKQKHQAYAIEINLEANNPDRALKITRKFRDEY